ncbi:hypothetical protein OH77DRAFT_1429961 [Trametes cingulata]|nr:hypothetical protein OH77DRAFT_1429961 [Trametes cingulata]
MIAVSEVRAQASGEASPGSATASRRRGRARPQKREKRGVGYVRGSLISRKMRARGTGGVRGRAAYSGQGAPPARGGHQRGRGESGGGGPGGRVTGAGLVGGGRKKQRPSADASASQSAIGAADLAITTRSSCCTCTQAPARRSSQHAIAPRCQCQSPLRTLPALTYI